MKTVEISHEKLSYDVDEAFKSLRTNLLFCGEEKKVIAITSCTPGEGKSTVSLNLALSLSESGKKVLFIDADLRKSVILGRVDVQEEIVGLSHFLSHQVKLMEAIYATNFPDFHVMFAGAYPPNPAELLGGASFKELLKVARPVYDYIIIDAPPLGSVIDAAVIADECDGSILVLAAGTISYRFAQNVKNQLARCACPILGVILNKVDIKQGYYGKYYGKYYGEYYGNDK
ncbi:polysaccharide biosynthesis tyrosine autokinase [Anaerostipes sp.]|uniref:polysaccharide biosynthesis tyrosine autokinase n=1 Tax=Anaerostipes sp. TaxID=1872530 RepID=UPI00258E6341|nr:polysaccharide biosynthesis tyrosine autokinase [Anaerostipes sp.]MCI5623938.1 polysaccharide biosynthesis tyrosine autokinase [Anaerostipes sp.]